MFICIHICMFIYMNIYIYISRTLRKAICRVMWLLLRMSYPNPVQTNIGTESKKLTLRYGVD